MGNYRWKLFNSTKHSLQRQPLRFSIDNQKYTFSFKSEDFQKLYPESEDIGIRYHLSWVNPLQRQIEHGKRRLVYGYHFNSVFVSPNKQYVAFMIDKQRYFHEGQGLDMMSNGTQLPLKLTQENMASEPINDVK